MVQTRTFPNYLQKIAVCSQVSVFYGFIHLIQGRQGREPGRSTASGPTQRGCCEAGLTQARGCTDGEQHTCSCARATRVTRWRSQTPVCEHSSSMCRKGHLRQCLPNGRFSCHTWLYCACSGYRGTAMSAPLTGTMLNLLCSVSSAMQRGPPRRLKVPLS